MTYCHERIVLGPRKETYCMRKLGHVGKHDPHPDPKPQEPVKK